MHDPSVGDQAYWKAICRFGQNISNYCIWSIGDDGPSINVISDPWFSKITLAKMPTIINMDILQNHPTVNRSIQAGGA